MSDKCKKCGGADFTPGGKCRPCQKKSNDAYRAKAAGGGSKVKTKKVKAPKAPKAAPLALEIPGGGYGFKAHVDGDHLGIEQTSEDEKDTIWLSRSEFKLLTEKFGGWALA